jgi:hypothetical protein
MYSLWSIEMVCSPSHRVKVGVVSDQKPDPGRGLAGDDGIAEERAPEVGS